jgi:phosphoglycolate phosphatase
MYGSLIFDLDGTLTDSKTGIRRSVNYALRACGIPELGERDEDYVWIIGPPLRESFRKLVGDGADDALVERLVDKYRERFEAVGIFENSLYPGVKEMLAELSGERPRRKLAIATTKPSLHAERVLEHFHLKGFFDLVVGSEIDGRMSEKYDLIREVMKALGGEPASYVMVGDREHDVLGARRAGIDSVGVLYGYGTESEIEVSGPTYTARSVAELRVLLKRI